MSASQETDLPIHVIFNIEKLGALPSIVKTKTDSATCKAIAEYLGVDAVENFQSELAVRRWRRHGATVEGMIAADIVQPCVVTLEPVLTHVNETVFARFLPAPMLQPEKPTDDEIVIDPLAEDPPEPFDGREINLGLLLLEHLALGIDPYPRTPGAAIPASLTQAATESEKRPNPFQVLAQLRDKQDR